MLAYVLTDCRYYRLITHSNGSSENLSDKKIKQNFSCDIQSDKSCLRWRLAKLFDTEKIIFQNFSCVFSRRTMGKRRSFSFCCWRETMHLLWFSSRSIHYPCWPAANLSRGNMFTHEWLQSNIFLNVCLPVRVFGGLPRVSRLNEHDHKVESLRGSDAERGSVVGGRSLWR